jgi:hypothetical protein
VLRGSQGFRDRIVGDPWIHSCNGYFEVYLLFKRKDLCFLKTIYGTSLVGDILISYNMYLILKNSRYPAASYSQIMQCLLRFVLVCIRIYLKSYLKYKSLILDYYHPDSICRWAKMWESVVIFRNQRGSQANMFGLYGRSVFCLFRHFAVYMFCIFGLNGYITILEIPNTAIN